MPWVVSLQPHCSVEDSVDLAGDFEFLLPSSSAHVTIITVGGSRVLNHVVGGICSSENGAVAWKLTQERCVFKVHAWRGRWRVFVGYGYGLIVFSGLCN